LNSIGDGVKQLGAALTASSHTWRIFGYNLLSPHTVDSLWNISTGSLAVSISLLTVLSLRSFAL
jgi:hypothetical protein